MTDRFHSIYSRYNVIKVSPAFKTVSFLILLSLIGLSVAIVYSQTLGPKGQDIRSHASNPADAVVDSDAVLQATNQSFQSLDTDPDLNDSAPIPAQDADLKEIDQL